MSYKKNIKDYLDYYLQLLKEIKIKNVIINLFLKSLLKKN